MKFGLHTFRISNPTFICCKQLCNGS